MDLWIEHAGSPDRLVLTWRAPEHHVDRLLWAVGELTKVDGDALFRYFGAHEIPVWNRGRTASDLEAAGFLGYPAFDRARNAARGAHRHALNAFMRRLPPRSRPDFPRYLAHFRLRQTTQLDSFALLGATEARLPGDGFALVDPLDPDALRRDLVLEIAGHRHYLDHRACLVVGGELDMIAEPGNGIDQNAVRFGVEGHVIGYVNRIQAPTIGRWLRERTVTAWLLRLNGTAASPRAFAFLRMRPKQDEQKAA